MFNTFYNLKINPFSETPDLRFFFKSQDHIRAIDQIITAISQGQGFLALRGEVGAGKTLLARMVMNSCASHAESALLLYPRLEGLDLILAINQEFGIAVPTTGGLHAELTRLTEFLIDNARKERRVFLIIDEAHRLSVDALEQIRLLSNIEGESRKLIQIIFIGQPELKALLLDPRIRQLRQRISTEIVLAGLKESEVESYLRHRIEIAGGNNFLRFSSESALALYRATQGNPRLINRLGQRIIAQAEKSGVRLITPEWVQQALKSDDYFHAGKSSWWPFGRQARVTDSSKDSSEEAEIS